MRNILIGSVWLLLAACGGTSGPDTLGSTSGAVEKGGAPSTDPVKTDPATKGDDGAPCTPTKEDPGVPGKEDPGVPGKDPVPPSDGDIALKVQACIDEGIDPVKCKTLAEGAGGDPGDPADAELKYKQCIAEGYDPAKCQPILGTGTGDPGVSSEMELEIAYKQCLVEGYDPAKCASLWPHAPQPGAPSDPGKDPAIK